MKVNEVAIILENKPGELARPCRALAESGVNILSLSLADTQKFGAMRLLTDDPVKARQALAGTGCVVKETEVVVVAVDDRPGGLAEALEAVEAQGVNVDCMYALTARKSGQAAMVFRFADTDQAISALQANGIRLLGPEDIAGPVA